MSTQAKRIESLLVTNWLFRCSDDRKQFWSKKNGGSMASSRPWQRNSSDHRLLPMWTMANLPGDFHRTHSLLPHCWRLRISLVLCHLFLFSIKSDYWLTDWLIDWLICFSLRRFVMYVCGSRGRDAILNVEFVCCDRPNPTLQVLMWLNFSSSPAISIIFELKLHTLEKVCLLLVLWVLSDKWWFPKCEVIILVC